MNNQKSFLILIALFGFVFADPPNWVSDGDGVPHITNKKIGGLTILLHAHGHAKKNLEFRNRR